MPLHGRFGRLVHGGFRVRRSGSNGNINQSTAAAVGEAQFGTVSSVRKRIQESPSLQSYPATIFLESYALARENAVDETELPLANFPEQPAFTLEHVLDETFLP